MSSDVKVGDTSAIEQFRQRIKGRESTSEHTINQYISWIRRFELWRSVSRPDENTLRDFDTYLQDPALTDYPWENRRGRPAPDEYAYRTRILALSATKLWLKHHFGEPVGTEVQNIAMGEPAPFDPTYLPESDIRDVIVNANKDCDNDDCWTALQVGYDAILRGAELVDVRREDVDLAAGSLYVRAVKGSNRITLDLNEKSVSMLRDLMNREPNRDKLFRNAYGRTWKAQAWNNHFRRNHHPCGFHAFARHSAIVNLLRDGAGFGETYQRARHSSPAMTTRYARLVGVEPPEWADE